MTPRNGYVIAVLAAVLGATLLLLRPEKPAEQAPAGASSATSAAQAAKAARDAPRGIGALATAVASTTPHAGGGGSKPAEPAESGSQPSTACPQGMVLVDGPYCPFVAHRCEMRLGVFEGGAPQAGVSRCGRFANTVICEGRPSQLHFCIDRYEYPNIDGVRPAVLVDFRQAERACKVEGKTLCHADEWAFACEGKNTWPYPHGLHRKAGSCNVDRLERSDRGPAVVKPSSVAARLTAIDGRSLSGARPRCNSPFGVGDTTGNVAEWVHDPNGAKSGAPIAVIGGHFGLGAATCRSRIWPTTRSHRDHRVGFRCCARARDGQPRRRLLPSGVRLSHRRKLL
ncbi:MAG: SUMF1/EgtB/PvdO family nonheme iron enzyme [Polyangiaceae bacterium]